jgi:hypothetical protein
VCSFDLIKIKNFLWPQASSLIPLPEVYTLYGEGGGIRTRISLAHGAAMLPMSNSRPIAISCRIFRFSRLAYHVSGAGLSEFPKLHSYLLRIT